MIKRLLILAILACEQALIEENGEGREGGGPICMPQILLFPFYISEIYGKHVAQK